MVDTAVWIVAIVVGVPVVCGVGSGLLFSWMKHRVKHRELRLQERKLAMEEELRQDELNAKLLRMDDFGVSPLEISSLADSIRQLREEVAQLRKEINSRATTL